MANGEEEKNVRGADAGSAVRTHGFVHKTFIVFGIGAIFLVAGVLLWHASQILLLLLVVPLGLFGVAMAAPLTAMLLVLVEMLYVQDVLGDSVTLSTERK